MHARTSALHARKTDGYLKSEYEGANPGATGTCKGYTPSGMGHTQDRDGYADTRVDCSLPLK